jgi:hypothetical protein
MLTQTDVFSSDELLARAKIIYGLTASAFIDGLYDTFSIVIPSRN